MKNLVLYLVLLWFFSLMLITLYVLNLLVHVFLVWFIDKFGYQSVFLTSMVVTLTTVQIILINFVCLSM